MDPEHRTLRQWQSLVLATRRRYMEKRRRIWPDGTVHACPLCTAERLIGCSDLTRDVEADGAVMVFANLHGARCEACGTEFLEAYEQIAIEERAGTAFHFSATGSVTSLGGKKLGTYWPKDVTEALGLHARDTLKITPLGPDTLVVRVLHDHP